MLHPLVKCVLVVVWLTLLLSCGTIDSQIDYWKGSGSPESSSPRVYIYGGTWNDILWCRKMMVWNRWTNPEIHVLVPLWLLDFPLSLAADTAILPMTLAQQLEAALRGGSPDDGGDH